MCQRAVKQKSNQTKSSRSTLFAILSSLIRVNTICHSQQSDQGLHCLPFSVWSGSTLFPILSLIRVYTICHSQQSDQGLHYMPFSTVWPRSTPFAILSSVIRVYTVRHSQQSDQGLQYLPFSAVWSGSTLFAIFSNLIKVYTICHSKQSDQGQGLHCHLQEQSDQDQHHLPFEEVWSRSTLSF